MSDAEKSNVSAEVQQAQREMSRKLLAAKLQSIGKCMCIIIIFDRIACVCTRVRVCTVCVRMCVFVFQGSCSKAVKRRASVRNITSSRPLCFFACLLLVHVYLH